MVLLFDRIKTFCLEQGFDKTYWIGYSGGLDSHVLLHLCAELRKQFPLRLKAVHVHHGLSVNAFDWALHCEKICADLQIEFIQKKIDAKALVGDSPEEVARDLRYAVFAKLIAPQDILLTAHQQDDQAETLLVQLFRGAGPKGLSAMPILQAFSAGFHARPLLPVSRAELKKYAEEHQLTWINDESNEDKKFTRNFLRHTILPVLKQRWPTVTKTLARVAENCAEAEACVTSIAIYDLEQCRGEKNNTLSVKKLLLLDEIRQRQVLRTWFSEKKIAVPSSVKLHQIQRDFLQSSEDRFPYICWDAVELRRYRNELYVMNCLTHHDATQLFSWDLTQPLIIPNLGELRAVSTEDIGLREDIKQVTVRFRQGGERCYFVERHCHHLLKQLMQEWGIPPWERDRIPLLFVDDILIAVVGFFLDARYQAVLGRQLLFQKF
jgi:tRNA(Ile)-lysidine synthase